MGFFSWKTCEGKSINNSVSGNKTFPVYLVTPDDEKLLEKEYKGYGVFMGKDAYALLARWNQPALCNGNLEHDRLIGIKIGCGNEKMSELKYPLKFTEDISKKYKDLQPAMLCEHQGFFYPKE